MSARFAKPVVFAFCLALLIPATLSAQVGNNGNNGNTFNRSAVGGVRIDASGVLSHSTDQIDPAIRLQLETALKGSGKDLHAASKMRMISMKGLDREIAKAESTGGELPISVRFLAGLQKIEYVIASPTTNDIIIAGPAEGLKVDADGQFIGVASGRPALRVEDLMVALQSVDNARTGDGVSVSINPTEEGVRNMMRMSAQVRQFDPSMQTAFEQAMGSQDVKLTGVPEDSRFSHVLVAADYKMKRIAMGLDPAPIENFPSLLDLAKSANASRMTAAPRFWMECDYEPLAKSEDNLVWQIRKSGVKTLTEEDRYDRSGKANGTGKQNRLAKKWADMMTERYDELADAEPVFRELQNLMDLSVAAAIIRKQQFGEQVGLKMPALLGETQTISLSSGNAPKTVPTRCSFVRITNSWLVTTSGGVQLDSWGAVENPLTDNELSRFSAMVVDSDNANWWWNAIN